MSGETKCPCCGNTLKERVSIDSSAIVHECQTWGCFFRCNCMMVDKICKAMKAQAKLDALKAAVAPVVEWWREIKPSHNMAKWPDFDVLDYGDKKVSAVQLELVAKALEDECKK